MPLGFNEWMLWTNWNNLVAETQFATELTVSGLRRLCSVPAGDVRSAWGNSNDLNYALHVGMHSYASGLERLCKLAIACNRYEALGSFPNLRSYSHRIGDLLDAVAALPLGEHGVSSSRLDYAVRPSRLDPALTNMVQRFANGAGRYEHLDALWSDDAEVSTFDEWTDLAARASVSKKVRDLIHLKAAVAYAIGSELTDAGLECAATDVIEDLDARIFEPSVGVVLSLFRIVRWVSTILDIATCSQQRGLPILGEVVGPTFIHTTANFFDFHIARVGDSQVTREELDVVYERIRAREAAMDDAVDDDPTH